jgi:hypothetical protein
LTFDGTFLNGAPYRVPHVAQKARSALEWSTSSVFVLIVRRYCIRVISLPFGTFEVAGKPAYPSIVPPLSPGEELMTADSALAEAPDFDALADTGLAVRSVAEFVAATLCGLRRVNGYFVHVNAAVGDDGYVAVEVTRVCFDSENVTLRVLLHPTVPVPVTPKSTTKIGPEPRSVA